MLRVIKRNMESNKTIKMIENIVIAILIIMAIICFSFANEVTLNIALAMIILIISILVIMLFSKCFTTYEKIWFISIMILASIFSILFPEEEANGINGIIIMFLYLLDTFLNILCELLISKQSRYNFLVSIAVEVCEIAICMVLMYRFATLASTLFFWLPIDIISFITWSKHKDEQKQELTVVRKLKGYQEVLIIIVIILWTLIVGYLLSGLNIVSDFINDKTLETTIIYLDACASAVGIANGLFIFFRLQEQWIAWYICSGLESIINILAGQYVLLILKLGYFTNTTYGYIKWNKYIKEHSFDDFSSEIVKELINEGYSGTELKAELKIRQTKIKPAITRMLKEASDATNNKTKYKTIEEVFDKDEHDK